MKKILKQFSFFRKLNISRHILFNCAWVYRGYAYANQYRQKNTPLSSVATTPLTHQPNGNLFSYFDGNTTGPGIWKWNHYFNVYERYLSKFVNTEATVVEVGIYSGGSLGMWAHYFGPKSKIVGIDIEPACRNYARENISVVIGDQADRQFWKEFKTATPLVDVLIDDGGHTPEQMKITLEEMLPHLRPGGVFITEDIIEPQNQFESYISGLTKELNTVITPPEGSVETKDKFIQKRAPSEFQRHIYAIHKYPFITVIEKTSQPYERFLSPKNGTEWQPFL